MKKLTSITLVGLALLLLLAFNSCIYSFSERKGGTPLQHLDSARTVRVEFLENNAQYKNPQLSPTLTERLRQKLIRQTRLTQTNNDNADVVISGEIRDYSWTTSGISANNGQRQASVNRLTVTVVISLANQRRVDLAPKEITASRSFDFPASQSIQQAERDLLEEMVRNLTDEIFNQLFSNW